MAKPVAQEQPWEESIVAEVRRAREEIFAQAGYDLDELGQRLNRQQQREGRVPVVRSEPRPKDAGGKPMRTLPNQRIQPARKRRARA